MNSLDPETQCEITEIYAAYLSEVQELWSAEQIEHLKAPLQLDPLQKAAIIFHLEQAIAKINVIHGKINAGAQITELPAAQPPLHTRINDNFCNKLYDKDTLQPIRDCYDAMTATKFHKDVNLTLCALKTCLTELRDAGRFSKLVDFIHGEKQEVHDERTIIENHDANLKILNELQRQRQLEQQETEKRQEAMRQELFRLRCECDDRRKTAKMEEMMVERWEAARLQQTAAIFSHELKNVTQQRDEVEEKTERELVANNETMAFYRASCDELRKQIDAWQRRYEVEKKDLDERIEATLANVEDVRAQYRAIRSVYEERAKYIDDYHREQAELADQLKREEKKTAAAVRMQAWWRGAMVRQQLGPYRPKKKSKKPKAGKK